MILVSSCLLGNDVKYNGGNNGHELLMKYKEYLTPICPECLGGLVIPRPPAEMQGGDGYDVLSGKARVENKNGLDITSYFLQGAEKAYQQAVKNNVKAAILKANSPSCGNTMIYDGSFSGVKVAGAGVTAAKLMEAGVKVYSEKEIDEELLRQMIGIDEGRVSCLMI